MAFSQHSAMQPGRATTLDKEEHKRKLADSAENWLCGCRYLRLGPKFDHQKPITSVVPRDGVWTPLMNAGLFAHCILAYQINMNVWTDLVLHLLQPAFKWSVRSRQGDDSCGNIELFLAPYVASGNYSVGD